MRQELATITFGFTQCLSLPNMKPKVLTKRCFKNFPEQSFLQDLKQGLSNTGNFNDFNNEFKNTLNDYAPIKTIQSRGNTKPHVKKILRK